MRELAIVMVLLAGCQKKDEPTPVPAPTPTETPKAAEAPKPAEATIPAQVRPPDPCVIKVNVGEKITFEGGGVKGESPGDPIDLGAVKPLAGTCSAEITATDATSYQRVVTVMDKLVSAGITDVTIETGASGSEPTTKPEKPIDPKEAAKTSPVIIITKTTVSVKGKQVGKVGDANLADEVAAALPKTSTDGVAILQADQSLTFATIRAAVEGAKKAHYPNVLFAVKNK